MNIVILDSYTANPGDLSWAALKDLGNVKIYDRTSRNDVMNRIKDADMVLTNKVVINAEHMANCPNLKYIGVLATGYNIIDTKAAADKGIVVTNIPSYSSNSVAQMVFAHILNIVNSVQHYTDEIHEGKWSRCSDFSYVDTSLVELHGRTLGIMGLGQIGNLVARIALAFGLKVIAYTSKAQEALPEGIRKVSKDELFEQSDILSFHCPLTPDTKEIVNKKNLSRMKPTAIVINTGRGGLVNEADLADALNSGTIFAAGVDVLSKEPPVADNPLLSAKNCYITPHIAWATFEARERLVGIAVDNIKAFLNGKPKNIIS